MRLNTLKSFDKNIPTSQLRISICEQNTDIAQIFSKVFEKVPYVEILQGNIFHLKAQAIVSPANSFGDMSGGFDKALDNFFEGNLQPKVLKHIQNHYLGEMPVGVADTIATSNAWYPYLIIAPTMRIPSNVGQSIHAYLAMRAILIAIIKHNLSSENKINHFVMPSLCTGVGRMPYQEAGEQILTAIHNILEGGWKESVHPALAPYSIKKNDLSFSLKTF